MVYAAGEIFSNQGMSRGSQHGYRIRVDISSLSVRSFGTTRLLAVATCHLQGGRRGSSELLPHHSTLFNSHNTDSSLLFVLIPEGHLTLKLQASSLCLVELNRGGRLGEGSSRAGAERRPRGDRQCFSGQRFFRFRLGPGFRLGGKFGRGGISCGSSGSGGLLLALGGRWKFWLFGWSCLRGNWGGRKLRFRCDFRNRCFSSGSTKAERKIVGEFSLKSD